MPLMTEENRISIGKEIVSNLQQVIHMKCKQVRLQGYIYCLVYFVVTTVFLILSVSMGKWNVRETNRQSKIDKFYILTSNKIKKPNYFLTMLGNSGELLMSLFVLWTCLIVGLNSVGFFDNRLLNSYHLSQCRQVHQSRQQMTPQLL